MSRWWALVLLFGAVIGVSGQTSSPTGGSGRKDDGSMDAIRDLLNEMGSLWERLNNGMGGNSGGDSESDSGGDSESDRRGGMGGERGGDRRGDSGGDRDGDGWGDGLGDMLDGMGDALADHLQNWGSALSMKTPAWRTQCPAGGIYAPYACEADPCDGAVCAGQPADDVHCVPDYCGARCMPVFYNKTGERVKCNGEQQGECPAVPYGFKGTCDHKCSSDDTCKAGQKCCSNGCGMNCVRAKFETDEDERKCKLVLGDQGEDGNQELWLFRPDEKGGMLYSTDARGNGTSFARFPGTRQEMAEAISEKAAEAQTEITVQSNDPAVNHPAMWKVEDEKIYRGEVNTAGETVWRVVALCNCKGCKMGDREHGSGQDRDGRDSAGGGMDGARERPGDHDGGDGPNEQGPGGSGRPRPTSAPGGDQGGQGPGERDDSRRPPLQNT
ncbi:Hypp8750 [Branchiostoma lanceolatum]|uniref:Hypp8750 protein n=1 Tax=Branchiostoma lanceolatum TaxID=7740 RepID=A0A8K0EFV0_BRALA|nr:Hypp8750 [Branchiostoma lanceolatum]